MPGLAIAGAFGCPMMLPHKNNIPSAEVSVQIPDVTMHRKAHLFMEYRAESIDMLEVFEPVMPFPSLRIS